jgi:hypothetical protein
VRGRHGRRYRKAGNCGAIGKCGKASPANITVYATGIGEQALNKGRPSPGGEEARVVVYQPRGVGLIHTRRTSRVMPTIHTTVGSGASLCTRHSKLLRGKFAVSDT